MGAGFVRSHGSPPSARRQPDGHDSGVGLVLRGADLVAVAVRTASPCAGGGTCAHPRHVLGGRVISSGLGDHPVRIKHELLSDALVEVGVALGCLIEWDHRGVCLLYT